MTGRWAFGASRVEEEEEEEEKLAKDEEDVPECHLEVCLVYTKRLERPGIVSRARKCSDNAADCTRLALWR